MSKRRQLYRLTEVEMELSSIRGKESSPVLLNRLAGRNADGSRFGFRSFVRA